MFFFVGGKPKDQTKPNHESRYKRNKIKLALL